MRTLEFKSNIENNQILIPSKFQPELRSKKNIRVIVFFDDTDNYDNAIFQKSASEVFLKGYADSDSVYDSY